MNLAPADVFHYKEHSISDAGTAYYGRNLPQDGKKIMKRPRPASQAKTSMKEPALQEPLIASPRPSRRITPREQQVLQMVWEGFMNRDIGRRLKISVRTVEAHRSSIMLKMGVSNTAQLLRQAIQLGLLKTGAIRRKPAKD
jgi:DNA-binding NarL/FixJ family response regulator